MGITIGSSLLWAVAFIVITKEAESSRRQHTTGGYNERNPFILEAKLPYTHPWRSESKDFGYTKWDSWTPDRTPTYRRRVIQGRNEDHLKSTRHKAPSGILARLIADLDSAYEAFADPARLRQKDFAKDKDALHQTLLNDNNPPHKRRSSSSTREDSIKWHRDRHGVQDELRSQHQLYKRKYPEPQKHRTDNWYPRDINKWLNPEHDIHKQYSYSSHLRTPNLRTGVFEQTKAKQWEESESTIKSTQHDGATTLHRSPNPRHHSNREVPPDKKLAYPDHGFNSETYTNYPRYGDISKLMLPSHRDRRIEKLEDSLWEKEEEEETKMSPLYTDNMRGSELSSVHVEGKQFILAQNEHKSSDEDRKALSWDNDEERINQDNKDIYIEPDRTKWQNSKVNKDMFTPKNIGQWLTISSEMKENRNTATFKTNKDNSWGLPYNEKFPLHENYFNKRMNINYEAGVTSSLLKEPHERYGASQRKPQDENYDFFKQEDAASRNRYKGEEINIPTTKFEEDPYGAYVDSNNPMYENYGDQVKLWEKGQQKAGSPSVSYKPPFHKQTGDKWTINDGRYNPQDEGDEIWNGKLQQNYVNQPTDIWNSNSKESNEDKRKENVKTKSSSTEQSGNTDYSTERGYPYPYQEYIEETAFDKQISPVSGANFWVPQQNQPRDVHNYHSLENDRDTTKRYNMNYHEQSHMPVAKSNIPLTDVGNNYQNSKEKIYYVHEYDSAAQTSKYKNEFSVDGESSSCLRCKGGETPLGKTHSDYLNSGEKRRYHVVEVNDEEEVAQNSNEDGNAKYAITNTPVTARIEYPETYNENKVLIHMQTSDNENTGSHKIDSPHIDQEQTFHEYNLLPVGEEVSAETADNFSNDEHSVQDSNEKGNTEYITTKMQVTDTIDNSVSDDERHEQPTREQKQMHVGEEVTAQTEKDLSNEENVVQDSNETGQTEDATSNTPQSEGMNNPATDQGRHEQTYSEYIPILAEEITAQTEGDVSNEEKEEEDSNQKGNIDYATTYTPATPGMHNVTTDDGRLDQSIKEYKPLTAVEELTDQPEDDVGNELKAVQDSNEKDNIEHATTNTPQSDGTDNVANDDGRHEQTTSEYKPIKSGEGKTAQSEDDINNEVRVERDSNQKVNTEYATTYTPATDGMHNVATDSGRLDQSIKEYKPLPSVEELTAQTEDNVSNEQKLVQGTNEKYIIEYAITKTPQSDGMDNPATDDGRHEQKPSEYKPILAGEEITAQTEDNINNEEKAEQDSNQKGNTDYATTYTPATGGMHNVATDDGRHDQSIKKYKSLPLVEELTPQPEVDISNELKAVHDSNEKGDIEYATINTPVSDEMATPPSHDRRHEQTAIEYKPFPVGEEFTAISVDHVSDAEKAAQDSNETGKIEDATTNTLSDHMGNPATYEGKKEQTTIYHKSMPVGKEGTAEAVEHFSKEAKVVPDSNEKGNTEYSTSNIAVTDIIDNPALDDDRHEQPTTEHKSTPVEKEETAAAVEDVSNEVRSEEDSYETGKTEDVTTNTPISDVMDNPATNDRRNEQTTTEQKSMPAGKERTAEPVGDLSNQNKTDQDSNKKEYTTSNTPLTDTKYNSALGDERREQLTKEHKQMHVGEKVTAQSVDLLSDIEKAEKDADEKDNTEYATTNTSVSDGLHNAAITDGRHEEASTEYEPKPVGEEVAAHPLDNLSDEDKTEQETAEEGNIEYATTNTPVLDGMDNVATTNGRHEETTREYKSVSYEEELTSEHEKAALPTLTLRKWLDDIFKKAAKKARFN